MSKTNSASLLDARILLPAIGGAFRKLDPRSLIRNPVMFVVATVSALTTVLLVKDAVTGSGELGFSFQIVIWLWFTLLFANFAEAVAEGRGKAQADALRRTRTETQAKLLTGADRIAMRYRTVPAMLASSVGDVVLVEAGDIIPSATARSSRASPRSTKRRSPASRRR